MSHATEKIKSGREPVWVVEIDLDFCDLVYGVGACTAAGGAGDECYNTLATSQDRVNYTSSPKTYSFCEPRSGIPPTAGLIPSLQSVTIAPTKITVGRGLGVRASVKVTFQDHPHHDRGIDPYVATRSYDPATQGTFWAKLRARNPFYQGRTMRIKSGYIGDTFDLSDDFVTRTYLLERIEGPDSKGNVTVTAKDVLKLADDERSRAPVANSGVLTADISDVAAAATLGPAGVGNEEYAASGTVRIGSETITFTRVADALTLTARGTDGTTATAHSTDDAVQECLDYTNSDLDDLVKDLLVTYAGIDSAWIIDADWQAEVDEWLSSNVASALITEPTGVKTLLDEICSQYMIDLWWDERNATIRFKVLAPHTPPLTQLTDNGNLVADTVRSKDEPERRVSQVWVHYEVIDPTESLTEARNFNKHYIAADLDSESTDEYGDSRIQTHFSRWFTGSGDALRLAKRTVLRYRDNPREFRFRLDGKDSTSWTGDTVELLTRMIQDTEGAAVPTPVRLIETREVRGGHAYEYKAIDDIWNGRYGRIAPDAGAADYSDSTATHQHQYAFVSADSSPYFPDGSESYRIV